MTAVSEIVPVGDRFAGSGSTGEACRVPARRCLGRGIDAAMAELARARIASGLQFQDGGGA